ncbi:MAG: SUMF1/EgtB/PvdO family nonheme iron enzyme [Pseudomonadota bacterium]
MPIFISYRRGPTTDFAGRIQRSIEDAFPDEEYFFDIDAIPAGVDFHDYIDRWINRADICVAVISADWNDEGQLENPDDFVRIELEAAVRNETPIIPVTVGDTADLSQTKLPEALRSIARRQAVRVHSDRMRTDVQPLITGIEHHLGLDDGSITTSEPPGSDSQYGPATGAGAVESAPTFFSQGTIRLFAVAIATAAIAGAAGYRFAQESSGSGMDAEHTQLRGENERLRLRVVSLTEKLAEAKPHANPATSTPGRVFNDRLANGGHGPAMVVVPAGPFMMGSPDNEAQRQDDEGPQRRVRIKAFAMSKYEVTFAEYDAFAKATGRKRPDDRGWGRATRPAINVSWGDAVAYVTWLSKQTGKTYRLPSEAEWEYAARAGTSTRYWWGDDVGRGNANCDGCGSKWDNKRTASVGRFTANPFGLHDTAGNVWEWTMDCYLANYQGGPADGTAREDGECTHRVVRGGGWDADPQFLRSADRSGGLPGVAGDVVGFRVARAL